MHQSPILLADNSIFEYLCGMANNSFGEIFRISSFGESHGHALGVVIDGCPAGLDIDIDFVNEELRKRRPGQSAIVTQRKEPDQAKILSGVFEGKSIGTPIGIVIENTNQKSKDYSHIATKYRPSHADYTYQTKYGLRDYRGGGRSSARETVARVAAGAIAKLLLKHYGISLTAYVSRVGELEWKEKLTPELVENIEKNPVRCPDLQMAGQMEDLIRDIRKQGDTIGGVVSCQIENVPAGIGEPVFDKLHADLAKAMMSINAAKGFEYGSGFEGTKMKGSEHNDEFFFENDKIQTKTNFSGGIQGGISNGMPIYFNVAFKPVATIMQDQESIDQSNEKVKVEGKGRHDPCVLPRAVPIVEAMAALVIADHLLRSRTTKL